MTDGPGFDLADLVAWLAREHGYSPRLALETAEDIRALSPPLLAAFVRWWHDGPLEAPEIDGYSLDRIIEEFDTNPVNAFLMLDWLARDPTTAREALARGYDWVE